MPDFLCLGRVIDRDPFGREQAVIEGQMRCSHRVEVAGRVIQVVSSSRCTGPCRTARCSLRAPLGGPAAVALLRVRQDVEQPVLRLVVQVEPRQRRMAPVVVQQALYPLRHRLSAIGRISAVDSDLRNGVRDQESQVFRIGRVQRPLVQVPGSFGVGSLFTPFPPITKLKRAAAISA